MWHRGGSRQLHHLHLRRSWRRLANASSSCASSCAASESNAPGRSSACPRCCVGAAGLAGGTCGGSGVCVASSRASGLALSLRIFAGSSAPVQVEDKACIWLMACMPACMRVTARGPRVSRSAMACSAPQSMSATKASPESFRDAQDRCHGMGT